jgi:hypothetical protein
VGEMVEHGKFKVKKFNDQKYQLWKMQMEDNIYQKDLFLPLGGKTKQQMSMKDKEWDIIDRKAPKMIQLCMAASVDLNI